MTSENSSSGAGTKIVRGPVDSLSIYEITDSELKVLEDGSPDAPLLNIAIACLTTGVSSFLTLLSVTVVSIVKECVFAVIIAIALAVGLTLLFLRGHTKGLARETVNKIKARIPPDPQSMEKVVQRPAVPGPTEAVE